MHCIRRTLVIPHCQSVLSVCVRHTVGTQPDLLYNGCLSCRLLVLHATAIVLVVVSLNGCQLLCVARNARCVFSCDETRQFSCSGAIPIWEQIDGRSVPSPYTHCDRSNQTTQCCSLYWLKVTPTTICVPQCFCFTPSKEPPCQPWSVCCLRTFMASSSMVHILQKGSHVTAHVYVHTHMQV